MPLLSINDVGKTFAGRRGETAGLHSIDLNVERGELISLLGPSGCGKTTTLRCIAGLETPDHGEIILDGRVLFSSAGKRSKRIEVPPESRGLAMVFQNYALWPHMNVFQNVAFGLRNARRSKSEIAAMVEKALRNVQLWDLRDRRISQLSGGQQQRIAVARAMAPDPKVILFDEPLSNMDTQLRENMRFEILELQEKMGLTSIWVTHDQEEALGMSSRIVLMNAGRVDQVGTPSEVWDDPATPFVAGFVGTSNRMVGEVVAAKDADVLLRVDQGVDIALTSDTSFPVGSKLVAFIRTGSLRVLDASRRDGAGVNTWRVPVELQSFHGDYTTVVVRFGGHRIRLRTTAQLDPNDRDVHVHVDPSDVIAFPALEQAA